MFNSIHSYVFVLIPFHFLSKFFPTLFVLSSFHPLELFFFLSRIWPCLDLSTRAGSNQFESSVFVFISLRAHRFSLSLFLLHLCVCSVLTSRFFSCVLSLFSLPSISSSLSYLICVKFNLFVNLFSEIVHLSLLPSNRPPAFSSISFKSRSFFRRTFPSNSLSPCPPFILIKK